MPMSYLCQNMKLLTNKLAKLQLFGFFDYLFIKKEKILPTFIQETRVVGISLL